MNKEEIKVRLEEIEEDFKTLRKEKETSSPSLLKVAPISLSVTSVWSSNNASEKWKAA